MLTNSNSVRQISDPVADWLAAATLILFCSTVLFGADAIISMM